MKNSNTVVQSAGGVSFLGLLCIAFIVLKLCGVINWSWVWVLAPLWIPFSITAVILAIVLLFVVYRHFKDKK